VRAELAGQFGDAMLGLGDGHAVAGHMFDCTVVGGDGAHGVAVLINVASWARPRGVENFSRARAGDDTPRLPPPSWVRARSKDV
jgi:hypothetical protein